MVKPSRQTGQRSNNVANYLVRILPQWGSPTWYNAERWRYFVKLQPVAMICKEALINNLLALDWQIVPTDPNMRDELKTEVRYYTKLFTDFSGLDYEEHVSWLINDLLDIPFGGASEIGREGDKLDGKVVWIANLDGGTLFPTLNIDYPVMQKVPQQVARPVVFPKHAISRIYLSPRTEIDRAGWGMTPAEKIFLAMVLLNRGDKYYAEMLLDVPEAGILDLGDMSEESASAWIDSFRVLMEGTTGFKVPVLYEHENPVNWIPFGRPPTDLMFNEITLKYAAIVAAGYGLTLSDIGMGGSSGSGETLAGSIRDERKSKRSGHAMVKKKLQSYFSKILPEYLTFKIIDHDDEHNVNIGRARLASANAFDKLIAHGVIIPEEARQQAIADGLFTIPMSELPPQSSISSQALGSRNPDTSDIVGEPVNPSLGGHGQIKEEKSLADDSQIISRMDSLLQTSFEGVQVRAKEPKIKKLVEIVGKAMFPFVHSATKALSQVERVAWNDWFDDFVFGVEISRDETQEFLELVNEKADKALERDDWWKSRIEDGIFLALALSAYELGLEYSSRGILQTLFEEGAIPTPYPARAFDVQRNLFVTEELENLVKNSIEYIDSGSKYYIKRVLISKVKEFLSSDLVMSKLSEGLDINKILSDNTVVRTLVQDIQNEIERVFDSRIQIITDFELGNVVNKSIYDEYRRAGLTKKIWNTLGPNPCEQFCVPNRKEGYVPIGFEYRSAFGSILAPKAHPNCQCELGFDRDEVISLHKEGKLNLWYGD